MTDPEKNTPNEPTAAEPKDNVSDQPFKVLSTKAEHDEYMENALKERLTRKDKKLEEERAETERKARENALKEQEDYKKLAGEYAETIEAKNTRISELEKLEAERDALTESNQAVENRLKGVLKPMVEGIEDELLRGFVERLAAEEQAEWFEKNADKLNTKSNGARPAGSRPTGRAQTVPKGEADKEARESQRISRVSAI